MRERHEPKRVRDVPEYLYHLAFFNAVGGEIPSPMRAADVVATYYYRCRLCGQERDTRKEIADHVWACSYKALFPEDDIPDWDLKPAHHVFRCRCGHGFPMKSSLRDHAPHCRMIAGKLVLKAIRE